MDGLLEIFLVGNFIACLRDEIQLEVKIKQPNSLAEAIGEARLIKEKNQLHQQIFQTPWAQNTSVPNRVNANPAIGVLGAPPTQPKSAPAIRCISN